MFRKVIMAALVFCLMGAVFSCAREQKTKTVNAAAKSAKTGSEVFRIGLIGLDTSHVIHFTRIINDPKNNYGCKVIAGYRGGSPDVKASATRIDKFTNQLVNEFGVEIVGSIKELCKKVDGILLESVDGRPHLKQVKAVIAAGKPVFVDKPMAGSLADVIEIFRLAEKNNVPCWSSSSLRFFPGFVGVKDNKKIGPVLGCSTYGPCHLEEHHPDLYWYGIHGVEALFTIMGPGCETVQRTQTKDGELVVGVWNDGRIGTFRGIRKGRGGPGAVVYGRKGIVPIKGNWGYKGLIDEIVNFFKTGNVPVAAEQTIEIYAFMSAADVSKAKNGIPVSLKSVIRKAKAAK